MAEGGAGRQTHADKQEKLSSFLAVSPVDYSSATMQILEEDWHDSERCFSPGLRNERSLTAGSKLEPNGVKQALPKQFSPVATERSF